MVNITATSDIIKRGERERKKKKKKKKKKKLLVGKYYGNE